ncbi:MAG: DUF481 domain-containing protein [Gemmatimonadaceae bacterium]|nr:DUF481 domain-containing protein [Gemmatimonadaceae bacterium]
MSRYVRSAVIASLAVCCATHGALAQTGTWSGRAEANTSVLFGAAHGRLIAFSLATNRADSTLDVRSEATFSYADARANDEDRSRVSARASRLSVAMDYNPFGRLSPFVFGSLESSLQQRIRQRGSAGVGGKLTFVKRGPDEVSLSLALLAERTRALDPAPGTPSSFSRTRWSTRVRASRQLTPALHFSHTTLYQPTVDAPSRYTASTSTAFAVSVTRQVSLTVTLRDAYDSEAVRRGARSNHDGQFLFGARTTF